MCSRARLVDLLYRSVPVAQSAPVAAVLAVLDATRGDDSDARCEVMATQLEVALAVAEAPAQFVEAMAA